MRILVVEDDEKLASVLRRGLERAGYVVDVATTGPEALWASEEFAFDAIVLDVVIPAPDGFAVCRQLRERGDWTPVLLLTARDAVRDRVEGLDAGADDYLVKPFAFEELFARLRALLRRDPIERPAVLRHGPLSLDPAARTAAVDVDGAPVPVELSAKEFALLELFLRRAGTVLTRAEILDHVWDFAYDGGSNVVDVYVRYLREKLDRRFGHEWIATVRGHGYRLG